MRAIRMRWGNDDEMRSMRCKRSMMMNSNNDALDINDNNEYDKTKELELLKIYILLHSCIEWVHNK